MTPYRHWLLILATVAALYASASPLSAAPPCATELTKQLDSSDLSARIEAIDLLGERGEEAAAAVPRLADLLQDQSPLVRAHAARALGRIGGPAKSATERLVALVGDDDAHVRRAAIRALRDIRPGAERVVPLFVKLMKGADDSVRIHAMDAVAESGNEAMPFLVEAVKDDAAAYWACLVISEIGADAEEAVPALTERLKDRRPEVRREAILALAAIGKAAAPAVSQLVEALDHPVDRIPATYALGAIGQAPPSAQIAIEKNAESDDALLADVSLLTLAQFRPDDKDLMRKAVEKLVQDLKSDEARIRGAAAQALVELDPDPEIARPIFAKAMDTAGPESLDAMMDALAGLGGKAIPRLIKALEIEQTRARAAAILERMGPAAKEAVPALTAALGDNNPETRSEVLLALGAIGPEAAPAAPAIAELLTDATMKVRYAACYALGQIGLAAAKSAPQLACCLGDGDEFLCMASAWALAKIDSQSPETAAKVAPVLIKALDTPDAMTRLHAAEALGQLGAPARAAVGKLEQLAKDDPNDDVREVAAESLKAIAAQK